jgi:general nucleoside transport system permease protein
VDPLLLNTFKSIVSNATPLVIAALGETITERAGVINLSLDGSIVLSAMAGFVSAYLAKTAFNDDAMALVIGVAVAMLVGALVALIIAWGDISLKVDQVAIGFVLTLLCADIAQFIGQNYTSQNAPVFSDIPLPILKDIPFFGRVFFTHDILVYVSYALMFGVWFWLFRTQRGLSHRAVGERPEAAFARGIAVNRLRYFYTMLGGAFIGLAGAAYSLNVKAGWDNPPSMRGDGWIALAIVIFGGWHPFRVVLGAYLFAGLRALTSALQRSDVDIPLVVLNAIPWVMMILTLLFVSSGAVDRLLMLLPKSVQNRARGFLRSDPPKALGRRF